MESGAADGDEELALRNEEPEPSDGSAARGKKSIHQLNAANLEMEVDLSARTAQPAENARGWPWGKARKNLRLPVTCCSSARMEKTCRGRVPGGEERTALLEGSAGRCKESLLQVQHNDRVVGQQKCSMTSPRRVQWDSSSVVTNCSAGRSKQCSKEQSRELPGTAVASTDAAAILTKRNSGRDISQQKTMKGRASMRTSVFGGSSDSRSVQDNKVQVHTAFSITSLNKVCSTFNQEKRSIVESIGLGQLLCLPNLKMFPRKMVLWLLSNMDSSNAAIKLTNGDEIPFTSRDVEIVLGLPCKGINVLGGETSFLSDYRRKGSVLIPRTGEEPNFKTIESILLSEVGRLMSIKERDAFTVAFVLYADAVFLGPKGQHPKINSDLLKKCSDPSVVGKLNWCDYVVRGLKHSARKVQFSVFNGNKNPTIEGCLLFLLVFYLDNLDFGHLNSDHRLRPRFKYFGPEIVKELVSHDKVENVSTGSAVFGRTKIRKKEEVVYLREHSAQKFFSETGKEYNQCDTNKSLSVILDKMNMWLSSVKDLTDATQTDLIKYFSSCKIEQEIPDSGASQMKHAPLNLNRDLHGNISRCTSVDSVRVGSTPVRFTGHVLIDLDTPTTSASKNCLEGIDHDMDQNISYGNRVDYESDNYLTSAVIGSDDDDFEDIELEGIDDGDDSISPEICENRNTVDETSPFMDDVNKSSVGCTLAAADDFQVRNNDHTKNKFLEGSYEEDNVDCSSDICANRYAVEKTIPEVEQHVSSPVTCPFAAVLGNDDLVLYGSALHKCDSQFQSDILERYAVGDEQYSNIISCLETEKHGQRELQTEQQNHSFDLNVERVHEVEDQEINREHSSIDDRDKMSIDNIRKKLPSTELADANKHSQHLISWNGVKFDGAHLRTNSSFGLSPFAVDLTHPDAPFASVTSLYTAMMNLTREDKERTWFVHKRPYELSIKGWSLHLMFSSVSDFSKDVINAIVRLFHSMDDELYASSSERRFRHFLPADFAETVLTCTEFNVLNTVSEMFTGYHVTYYVGECKLILLPVLVDQDWSLYAWNFERKTVTVIDPVEMVRGSNLVMRKHKEVVDKLHKAMVSCKQQLFTLPPVHMMNWEKEFLAVEGANVDSSNSGLYTMFYGRYFDGKTLTRILTHESQRIHKCNILYQLLTLQDNVGDLPAIISQAIPRVV